MSNGRDKIENFKHYIQHHTLECICASAAVVGVLMALAQPRLAAFLLGFSAVYPFAKSCLSKADCCLSLKSWPLHQSITFCALLLGLLLLLPKVFFLGVLCSAFACCRKKLPGCCSLTKSCSEEKPTEKAVLKESPKTPKKS